MQPRETLSHLTAMHGDIVTPIAAMHGTQKGKNGSHRLGSGESFTIPNISRKHNGVYRCVVKNSIGRDSKKITLDVPCAYDCHFKTRFNIL